MPANDAQPRIRGVLAPVVTPFDATLAPDLDAFIAQCRWLIDAGVGLAIFGTNSEAASISAAERLDLTDKLIEAGIPASRMMPGTGACSITEAATLTTHAVKHGAAGALMLPPFYFKGVSDDGLFGYYSEVIERVGDSRLRVYLYHIPQMSAVPITMGLIERLLKRYPGTVAGAKDSSGDWSNSLAMIENFAKDGFDVFPASESLLAKALPIGGAGCISATVNVNPAQIQAVYDNHGTEEGVALQAKADVIRQIYQATAMIPAMKRTIAHYGGKASWAHVRPPLTEMADAPFKALLDKLETAGFSMPGLK